MARQFFPLAVHNTDLNQRSRFVSKSSRSDSLSYDSCFSCRVPRPADVTEAVQFVVNNWMLVLVAAVSGAMLLWPLIQRRLSPVREIGVQGATPLINRNDAVIVDLRERQG